MIPLLLATISVPFTSVSRFSVSLFRAFSVADRFAAVHVSAVRLSTVLHTHFFVLSFVQARLVVVVILSATRFRTLLHLHAS